MIMMCMHLLIPQRVCYTSALLEGLCGNCFVFGCKPIAVNYGSGLRCNFNGLCFTHDCIQVDL